MFNVVIFSLNYKMVELEGETTTFHKMTLSTLKPDKSQSIVVLFFPVASCFGRKVNEEMLKSNRPKH